MNEKKLLAYPMKATVIYLLFTIVLFVFGPIRWNIPSYPKLVIFLLIYIAFFAFGYKFQLEKKLKLNSQLIGELSDPHHPSFGILGGTNVKTITLTFVISCFYYIIRHRILMIHMFGSVDFTTLFTVAAPHVIN